MIRVQIYLDEQDDQWLEERASAQGTTKSALMREGLRMLQAQRVPLEEEPLLQLVGLIKDPDPEGATDVSERHDWYLTQWELQRNRLPKIE